MKKVFLPLYAALSCMVASAQEGVVQIAPDWQFWSATDKITDMTRGFARAQSGNGGILIVKCDGTGDNEIYAQFIFDKFIGSGAQPSRPITYRADGGTPQIVAAMEDKNYAAIFSTSFARFANDIASAKKLVVRATTFEGEDVDAELRINGAAIAIHAVAQACGTKSPVN